MSILDLFNQISAPKSGPIDHLVVGLGNPGAEYVLTRHNAGFAAIDSLAAKEGIDVRCAKFSALVGDGMIGGHRVMLMKPQTFMNLSGNAVCAAARFYKIEPQNVIVLCDDVNLDAGVMRIRRKGSHGGHNGLKDIASKLGTDAFVRIRLGVGKKPCPEYDLADFVLGKLTPGEQQELANCYEKLSDAIRLIVNGNLDDAMSRYNG